MCGVQRRATSNSCAFCQAEVFSQALRVALKVHTFGLQTCEAENSVNMCVNRYIYICDYVCVCVNVKFHNFVWRLPKNIYIYMT